MKNTEKLQVGLTYLVKNWDKFKQSIRGGRYGGESSALIEGVNLEEHIVILLLDRQKPSVEASYDFDEERIGVTKTGKIIWGFDSGCSCPSPWEDSYPGCYKMSKTFKQFEVNLKDFDVEVVEECQKKVDEIKQSLKK